MLNEFAYAQGAEDSMAKFAIMAEELRQLIDTHGHLGANRFNNMLRDRMAAEGRQQSHPDFERLREEHLKFEAAEKEREAAKAHAAQESTGVVAPQGAPSPGLGSNLKAPSAQGQGGGTDMRNYLAAQAPQKSPRIIPAGPHAETYVGQQPPAVVAAGPHDVTHITKAPRGPKALAVGEMPKITAQPATPLPRPPTKPVPLPSLQMNPLPRGRS